MEQPSRVRLVVLLTIGIMSVSCGSLFIRLASAPALAAAAYRVLLATVVFIPVVASGPARELIALTRGDWMRVFLAGLALACHFALWIASLSYTSVASSVVLVDTTPFFIGLASHWFFSQPCGRSFWTGLTVAFTGCVVVFQGDWLETPGSLMGNALAIGGAIAMAVYFFVGGRARQRLSLLAFVWPVYGTAAAVLILAGIVSRTPLWGFQPSTYVYLFLLALIPQCIGHTSYNWALRWLSPAKVALTTLAEPVGASLLAYLFLNEELTGSKIAGGGVILLGIYIATRRGSQA
jgi:drug/metabolite transporter (DMT)-like permease